MAIIEITSCYQCPTNSLELVLARNNNYYGFCTHCNANTYDKLHSSVKIGRGNTADDFPIPDWCPHVKKG